MIKNHYNIPSHIQNNAQIIMNISISSFKQQIIWNLLLNISFKLEPPANIQQKHPLLRYSYVQTCSVQSLCIILIKDWEDQKEKIFEFLHIEIWTLKNVAKFTSHWRYG